MESKGIKLTTHEEVDIFVDHAGQFHCTMDGEEVRKDSLSSLTDSITRFNKNKTKVSRRKLSIPCVSNEGKKTTVTGVHGRNGELLMTPTLKEGRFDGKPTLYYDCPKTAELLSEKNRLQAELENIKTLLTRLSIRTPKSYYGAINDESHIDKFLNELETMANKAKSFGTKN